MDKSVTVVKSYSIYNVFRRTIDIIFGLFGLMVFILLFGFVKVLNVMNGDFGPVLLTQNRIGKNGKEFAFYKFRSMVVNADEILFQYLSENPVANEEYRRNKKLEHDPRITKVGRFLRNTSLDEIPQVLNVLKGDMSIIGNRPYLPREKEDMGDKFDVIVSTKPGMSGYWQAYKTSHDWNERLEMEEFYSLNYGLKIDLKIFIRTFKVLLHNL